MEGKMMGTLRRKGLEGAGREEKEEDRGKRRRKKRRKEAVLARGPLGHVRCDRSICSSNTECLGYGF